MSNNKLCTSSSPVDEQSVKLKEISCVIRALVTSRKAPCTLNDILNDYKDVEGSSLAYHEMGFKTAEELLMKTGEFEINKFGGKVCISSKYHVNTAHISALVGGKKSGKSKLSLFKSQSRSRINYNCNNTKNSTQLKVNNFSIGAGDSGTQRNNNNNNANYKGNKNAEYQVPITNTKQYSDLRECQTNQQTQKLKHSTEQPQCQLEKDHTMQKDVGKVSNFPADYLKPCCILKEKYKYFNSPNDLNNNNNPDEKNVSKMQQNELPQQEKQQLPQEEEKSINISQKSEEIIKNMCSDVKKITEPKVLPARSVHPTISVVHSVEKSVLPLKTLTFNPLLDAITSLSLYCAEHGFREPIYKSFYSKLSKLYHCRTIFDGNIFFTYPNEYPTENLATKACAQSVIDKIREAEQRKPLPKFMGSNEDFIEKLYAELMEHPNGVFVKSIGDYFENTYKQALPDNWWTLVQTCNRFITETLASDKVIVLANTMPVQPSSLKINSEIKTNNIQVVLEELRLPWHLKYWNVLITYCVSEEEIWVRLIEPEYSAYYDIVYNEIEREQRQPAIQVVIDNIYLAFAGERWHRVRVRQLENQKNLALCHFVDVGKTVWLPVSHLCVCHEKYLSLPAQAVALALFGNKGLTKNKFACSILKAQLLNHIFLAKILTKEEEFCAYLQPIEVTFYYPYTDVEERKLTKQCILNDN